MAIATYSFTSLSKNAGGWLSLSGFFFSSLVSPGNCWRIVLKRLISALLLW
jgi:hypothetical protein